MNIIIYINEKKLNDNFRAAIAEYTKRLSAYCTVKLLYKPEASLLSDRKFQDMHLKDNTDIFHITCNRRTLSSETFAKQIETSQVQGISQICYLIGYSDPSLTQFNELALTSVTMSHALTGVVLCEQLYRSYRIINHQPYHK